MLFLSGILFMFFFVGFRKPHTTRHHHYPCAFIDVLKIKDFANKEVTNTIRSLHNPQTRFSQLQMTLDITGKFDISINQSISFARSAVKYLSAWPFK